MAENKLRIQLEANLANADEIVKELSQIGKEFHLFDADEIRDLKAELHQIQQFLNNNLLQDAEKAINRITTTLLKSLKIVKSATGIIGSEVGDLNDKITEAGEKLRILQNKLSSGYIKRNGNYRLTNDNEIVTNIRNKYKQQFSNLNTDTVYGTAQDLFKEYKKAAAAGSPVQEELKQAIAELGYTISNGVLKVSTNINETVAELQKNITEANDILERLKNEQAAIHREEPNIKIPLNDGRVVDIAAAETSLMQGRYNQQKAIEEEAEAHRKAVEAIHQKQAAEEELAMQQQHLTKTTVEATDAQNQQNNAVSKAVTTFFGYQMILRQLRKLWREAIHTITELDKELTNQSIVTRLTREETWGLVKTYQDIADQAGVTQVEVANVTTAYLRQGETLANSITLTKAAIAAATVAGISSADSVKYLTTAIHGFKLEAEDALEVSDKFASLAAQAATTYEDLAIALSKVASQASLAGMSMDYTLAILTTGLDVTQEAPESIGTALKTVIARMREISDYGKTLEDNVDLNQVESGLRAVGIALRDGIGELRSTEDVLTALGQKWKTLTANQQAAVAKALAGTRQQSRLVAILDNYSQVERNLAVSLSSVGATTAQQVKYLDGMEAAMKRLTNAYQSFIESLVESKMLIGLVNFATDVIKKITKFLETPFGKTAFISGLISIALKSEQLITRIKNLFREIEKIIVGNTRAQSAFNVELNKTLQLERQRYLAQTPSKVGAKQVFQSISRGNFKNTAGQFLNQRFRSHTQFGSTIQADVSQINNTKSSITGFNTAIANLGNNSRKAASALMEQVKATQAEIDQQQQRKFNDPNNWSKEDEEHLAKLVALRNQELAAAQKQQVLGSRLVSYEEKRRYLANEQLLAEKKKLLEDKNQTEEEKRQTAQDIAQLEAEQKQTRSKVGNVGGALSNVGEKAAKIASIGATAVTFISTLISCIKDVIDAYDNALEEIRDQTISNVNKIQSEIYTNTQTKKTIVNLLDSFETLNKKVLKTADDFKEMSDISKQLAEVLGISTSEIRADNMQYLRDVADQKILALDKENKQLVNNMNKELFSATEYGGFNWGNIFSKTAMMAGAGAGLGGSIGSLASPAGTAIGGLIGGAVGGVTGLIAGIVEEKRKEAAYNDALAKIDKLIESDEGREQIKTYMQYAYTGKSGAAKDVYSLITSSLTEADLKDLKKQYGGNFRQASQALQDGLASISDSLNNLTSDSSNYVQRTQAAQDVYNNLMQRGLTTAAEAFARTHGVYLQLGNVLGEHVELLDKEKWSLTQINDVITAAQQAGMSNAEIQALLEKVAAAKTPEEFAKVLRDVNDRDVADAIRNTVTNGRSIQDISDNMTASSNKIANLRSTQAKWGSMSVSERQQFMDDNAEFFRNEEAMQAFIEGRDITKYLADYRAELQKTAKEQILQQQKVEQSLYDQAVAERDAAEEGSEAWETANAKVLEHGRNLRTLALDAEEVEHMFDLTIDDIVAKQQQQIDVVKEVYQAQEQALIDSLNKRKEAYQKYFDAIAESEQKADYVTSRDQLIESISKLSGGTDATSRNKVYELQKQLATLEKEEMQRQKENARQAVLDNIDAQVASIEENMNEMLNNSSKMLALLTASTGEEYLALLEKQGYTPEQIEQIKRELGDTLRGTWSASGLNDFKTVTVSKPESTVINQQESAKMTINIAGQQTTTKNMTLTELSSLVNELIQIINARAGTNLQGV